jgi:hypothetical protein
VLILKIKKNIILIYFLIKIILKNNYNYILKQTLKKITSKNKKVKKKLQLQEQHN